MATESDNVNTGALGTITAVGALAVLGIALAVTALVRAEVEQENQAKGATANTRAFTELEQSQKEKLSGIDQSMDQTVKMLVANPWSATPGQEEDAGSDAAETAASDAGAPDAQAEGEGDAETARDEGEAERDEDRVGKPEGPGGMTPEEIAETIPGEPKKKAPPPDEKVKDQPAPPPDGEDAP